MKYLHQVLKECYYAPQYNKIFVKVFTIVYLYMKIALGFYGITRSLKYTIDSINDNILNVFKLNNIDYDIYMHTYYLSSYENIRTGEINLAKYQIDNEEYKLLNPKYFKQDNQDDIKKELNLLSYRTCKDPWKSNYVSVDNYILACYSKHILTNMIEKNINEYKYILFIRPDCLYISKFETNFLNFVNNYCIVTPNFGCFGKHPGYKINDRFIITNNKTYKIYGNIFKELLEISKELSLHSETILGLILAKNNIENKKINFYFIRIRMNGSIPNCDSRMMNNLIKTNLKYISCKHIEKYKKKVIYYMDYQMHYHFHVKNNYKNVLEELKKYFIKKKRMAAIH